MPFDTIPVNFNLPGAYGEFNSSRAQRALAGVPHKLLLIGQKQTTGDAVANEPVLLSLGNLDDLLGKKSIIASMARFALNANPYGEIYALPINDASTDTAAAYTLNITGTVLAEAGTFYLYFAGKRIAISLTAASVDSTVDEIKAGLDNNDTLPIATVSVVKTATEKSITITMQNKGVIGNGFMPFINALEGETTPSGMALVISQTVTGVGAPADTIITANLGDTWFTEIVNPYGRTSGIVTAIDTALETRNGGTVQLSGIQFTARVDSYSNLTTYLSAVDSQYLTVLCLAGNASPEPIIASVYAAIVGKSANEDAGKPLQYIALDSIYSAGVSTRLTDAERNVIIGRGGATVKIRNRADVTLERAVTTYKTNQAGVASLAYKDLETIYTLITLRYQMNVRLLLRYPRAKLGNDTDLLRSGVARPRDVKAEIVALAVEWLNAGLITDVDAFQNGLAVERDSEDAGRLVVILQPQLIGQLRQIFTSVQFSK